MIVICPLEFERAALRRAARAHGWTLVCTGPADGPARWVRESVLPRGSLVVLAGVAAGLVAPARAGSAWAAGGVICADAKPHGNSTSAAVAPVFAYRPTFVLAGAPTATIACVDALLLDAGAKRRVAAATGASLADMESGPFARAAGAAGLRWAVVRGVSDAVDDALPSDVVHWTDAAGRTRVGAVAGSLLRRPGLLPHMVRMGRSSRRAMRAVATLLSSGHNATPP